jgi:MSHA biogenesis protein MshN
MDSTDISGRLPSAKDSVSPPSTARGVPVGDRREGGKQGVGAGRNKAGASVAPIAKLGADAPLKTTSPHQKAEYLYQKALSLMEEGRMAEARDNLDNALAAEPGNAGARQLLAGILIDGKKIPQAEAVLQAGLALTPEQTGLAMLQARLQIDQADLSGALATLRKTQSYAADNADYQAFMAALLQRAGQHGEAIEHYRTALRRNPSSGPWLVGLGISLQAENRLTDAQEAFIRAKSSGALNAELQGFVEQRLGQIQQQLR